MVDQHLEMIRDVTPSADGCEDCLRIGSRWVHLRLCLTCGHVGCCTPRRIDTRGCISMKAGIRSSNHSSQAKLGAGAMCTKRRSNVGGCRPDSGNPFLHGLGDELQSLSERMCSGTPRKRKRSESMSMTSMDFSFRSIPVVRLRISE